MPDSKVSTKTKIIGGLSTVTLVAGLFAAVWQFDDRWANRIATEEAHDEHSALIIKQQMQIEAMQSTMQLSSKKILDFLKQQAISRKTILEMKEAGNGGLKPEEIVELNNLRTSLKHIQ